MDDKDQVPPDSESPMAQKERKVHKHWFDKQPIEKQSEIIKPHFDQAHPTNDDVRETVKDYDKNG